MKRDDSIIDIGSNDGTFLSFFERKYNLLAVDPTIKKFSSLYRQDIKIVPDFFSREAVEPFLKKNEFSSVVDSYLDNIL